MKTAWSLCAIALFAVTAFAEDEAQTGARRWFLDMSHGPLKTVIVESPSGSAHVYHYMTFEVKNPTAHPRAWNPLVKAITDTKDPKGGNRTYVAGGFTDALDLIRVSERNPRLVALNATAGRIQPGQEVQAVAIFGVVDSLYDTIKIEVHGLADPVATYKVEDYGAEVADGDEITPETDWVIVDSAYWDRNQAVIKRVRARSDEGQLPTPATDYVVMSERRLWEMVYERLGDEFRAEDDLIKFKHEGWKIQGNPKKLRSVTKPTQG